MSQDNIVTGVSWAWNSPKRTIPEDCRPKPRPLLASNNVIIPPKEPDLRKKTTERLVGFYKFQEELKKIQLEQQNTAKERQTITEVVKPPSPVSPNGTDLFDSFGETEADGDEAPPAVAANVERPANSPYLVPIDSFNDSAFDSLLLQASQAAEKKSDNVPDAAADGPTPMKRKSFFKSRTINDLDSVAVNDLLNDSTDFCLIEASQLVEGKLKEPDQKTMEPGGSKKTNTLTRHKSLPASPSQKAPVSPHNPDGPPSALRSKYETSFPKSDSAPSTASAHDSASPQPVRLCTKEEIEQKRQEALKRLRQAQARRLNRLGLGSTVLNNNHMSAAAARKS
uniref:Uncharacterized protein n=1 Tax=Culex tarsalis TaxID=7177 RepID=A0A1Q3G0V7_CULTA